jgi:hypothetical protein
MKLEVGKGGKSVAVTVPGGTFRISAEDISVLVGYSFWIAVNGYVYCKERGSRSNKERTLHSIIYYEHMGRAHPASNVIDHANRDKLDNRRENLRAIPHSDNVRNQFRKKSNTPYKGVWFRRHKNGKTGSWVAELKLDDRRLVMGGFESDYAAALQYNRWVLLYRAQDRVPLNPLEAA